MKRSKKKESNQKGSQGKQNTAEKNEKGQPKITVYGVYV
jgi:hypothetical protein